MLNNPFGTPMGYTLHAAGCWCAIKEHSGTWGFLNLKSFSLTTPAVPFPNHQPFCRNGNPRSNFAGIIVKN
jgi:hypothetical protein